MSDTIPPVPDKLVVPVDTTATVDRLRSPQFLVACLLIGLLYFIVVMTFIRGSENLILTVTNLSLGLILGTITGFYFGSSTGSQRKDPTPLPSSGGTSTVTTTSTPTTPITPTT